MCGKRDAKVYRVARSCGTGARLLVVENVPVVSCLRRGGSHFTADTMTQLERVRANRKVLAKRRHVSVTAFPS